MTIPTPVFILFIILSFFVGTQYGKLSLIAKIKEQLLKTIEEDLNN